MGCLKKLIAIYFICVLYSCSSEYRSSFEFKEDKTPPPPPVDVNFKVELRDVILYWGKVSELDLKGYNVYRSLSRDAGFNRVNAEPVSINSYRDTNLADNTTYYYALTSVDINDNESSFSQPVEVFVPEVDSTPPSVIEVFPPDGSNIASPETLIYTKFNEPLYSGSILQDTVLVKDSNGNAIPGEVVYSPSTYTIYFYPLISLTFNTAYSVETRQVQDTSLNFSAPISWIFTTVSSVDRVPPVVVEVYPADNQTQVPVTTYITSIFSESLDPATVNNLSFYLLDQNQNMVNGIVSYDNYSKSVTFTPSQPLYYGMKYRAVADARIADISGNAMSIDYVWHFQTEGVPDILPPSIVSTYPNPGAQGVQNNVIISATFDEPIDPNSANANNFLLYDTSFNQVSGLVSYDSNLYMIKFIPQNPLKDNETYYPTLTTGIRDLYGNHLTHDYIWSFTTANNSPPYVVSTNPQNNEFNVDLDQLITAKMSEAIDPRFIQGSFNIIEAPTGNPVDGNISYDANTYSLTFSPVSPLSQDIKYIATIQNLRDLYGKPMTSPYSWVFTTRNLAPFIVNKSPFPSEKGVETEDLIIEVYFSECVNTSDITDSNITLTVSGQIIPLRIIPLQKGCSTGSIGFEATPDRALDYGIEYTITVQNINDLPQNYPPSPMLPDQWNYTTTLWRNIKSGVTSTLLGIAMADNGDGWISGSNETILNLLWSGNNPTIQVTSSIPNVYDIDFYDAQNGIAVGDQGIILRTTDGGATWILEQGPAMNLPSLYGVSYPQPLSAWAVGDGGVILKWDGVQWLQQSSPVNVTLHSVYFTDILNGWAVGDRGNIIRTNDGGINWILESSPFLHDLHGIWMINNTSGWAVGEYGTLLYYNNGSWEKKEILGSNQTPLGIMDDFYNVYFDGSNVYIVTSNGNLLMSLDNGGTWNIEFTSDSPLYDVRNGIVVGENGYYYFNTQNGWTTVTKYRINFYSVERISNTVWLSASSDSVFTTNLATQPDTLSCQRNCDITTFLKPVVENPEKVHVLGGRYTIPSDFKSSWIRSSDSGFKAKIKPAIQGLYSYNTEPTGGEMDVIPLLIDNDLTTQAIIVNLNGNYRNMGLRFSGSNNVDKLSLYVNTNDPGIGNYSFGFKVFSSTNGINWNLVTDSPIVTYNQPQSRFEISFTTSNASYFKVVNTSYPPGAQQINVTEIEAYNGNSPVSAMEGLYLFDSTPADSLMDSTPDLIDNNRNAPIRLNLNRTYRNIGVNFASPERIRRIYLYIDTNDPNIGTYNFGFQAYYSLDGLTYNSISGATTGYDSVLKGFVISFPELSASSFKVVNTLAPPPTSGSIYVTEIQGEGGPYLENGSEFPVDGLVGDPWGRVLLDYSPPSIYGKAINESAVYTFDGTNWTPIGGNPYFDPNNGFIPEITAGYITAQGNVWIALKPEIDQNTGLPLSPKVFKWDPVNGWTEFYMNIYGNRILNFNFLNDSNGWGVGENGLIIKWDGYNWNIMRMCDGYYNDPSGFVPVNCSPFEKEHYNYPLTSIDCSNVNINDCIVVGSGELIMETTDAGITWNISKRASKGTLMSVYVNSSGTKRCAVGIGGSIYCRQ